MADETPAPAPSPSLTPEEAAAMQQQLMQYQAEQAAQAAADRAEKLKPLVDLFASDAWTQVRDVLSATSAQMIDEPFFDSLRAADKITGLLQTLVR